MNNFTFRRTTFFILFTLFTALSTAKAQTLYSFKSGDYNDPEVWTLNSSGITYDNPSALTPISDTGHPAVILSGRTVTISPFFPTALDIYQAIPHAGLTIQEGAILEVSATVTTAPEFSLLDGQGTLLMHSTNNLPTGIGSTSFVKSGGGTVEYNYTGNLVLPSQDTYNNLTINLGTILASAIVSRSVLPTPATLPGLAPFTINGNLTVKQGIFQIGENGVIGNAPSSDVRLKITIGGDVTVDASGSIKVGTVNPNNATLTTDEFTGRIFSDYSQTTGWPANADKPGPFFITSVNNRKDSKLPFKSGTYHQIHHQVYIGGSLTNNGTVRFHNLTTLDLDQISGGSSGLTSATSGAATVFFQGLADDTLTCNGQTDFYNLVLNKGTDPTYSLTINPSTYTNFRLWGPTSIGADQNNYLPNGNPNGNPNPIMRKALWINNGTLKLTGQTVIPSLSESGDDVIGNALYNYNYSSVDPTGDFYIPANGAMIVDGPEVIVLTTADYASEVAMAYGLSTANVQGVFKDQHSGNQSLSIYGAFTINSGYVSGRESGGFIYWSIAGGAGNVTINGGVVDVKQFRSAEQTPAGRSTFTINGGSLRLRGRFQTFDSAPPVTNATGLIKTGTVPGTDFSTIRALNGYHSGISTFNIANAANVFTMTGGDITILDVGTNSAQRIAFEVNSTSPINTYVSGGTVNVNVVQGTGHITENFDTNIYDYVDADYYIKTTAPLYNLNINRSANSTNAVILNTQLLVKNNLTVNSGVFNANNLSVTIGKDFNLYTGSQYITGTNTTTFNGTGNQNFLYSSNSNITFTGSTLGLKNLAINKTAGTLTMGGNGTDLTVNGNLSLLSGTFDDGGVAITVKDSVFNSATHTSTNGGKIILGGTALQIINGNGNGIFANLQLKNATGAKFINAGQTVSGQLRLEAGILDISIYPLTVTSALSTAISPSTSTGVYSNTNMIRTAGNQSDGGVIKKYGNSDPFIFPVGTLNTTTSTNDYAPATIAVNATAYGNITVKPVSVNHPFVTGTRNLNRYWKVVAGAGFSPNPTVSHTYQYVASDISPANDDVNAPYVAAVYNPTAYSTTGGNINTGNKTFGFTSLGYITGDFTAGKSDAFSTVVAFYSRMTGDWNTPATWSNVSNSGVAASSVPTASSPVFIGNGTGINHTITVAQNGKRAGALQISTGSTLDVGTTINHNFGAIPDLKITGAGMLKISSATAKAQFPAGDFGNFLVAGGGTVVYYTTGSSAFTIPARSASPTLANLNTYNNLTVTPTGSTITFPDTTLTTYNLRLYGDLTVNGNSTGIAQLNDGVTTTARTLTINGSIFINGGRLRFMNAAVRNIVLDGFRSTTLDANGRVDGRITIGNSNGAGFDVNGVGSSVNTISLVGSIITNGTIDFNPGAVSNRICNVTFTGTSNEAITGTNGSTRFGQIIVNKGTSQASILTLNLTGAGLSLPFNSWLSLLNGTFQYVKSGSTTSINITNNLGTFQIPATAAFTMAASALTTSVNFVNASGDGADLLLSGKLKVSSGIVNVGSSSGSAYNNDIEYAAAGLPEIEVIGGRLYVNGQIRRPAGTNITLGSLVYKQLGGDVIIGGNSSAAGLATSLTRAKFEIDNGNNGSQFNMTAGTLTILRGNGNVSDYGDLYIHPGSSSVTGGAIILAPSITSPALSAGGNQTYTINSSVDLFNVTIGDGGTYSSITQLNVNPLRLLGDLEIKFKSTLDTKGLNVRVSGNFTNGGIYLPGANTTTFNGAANKIATFNSSTAFNNLTINKSGSSLTLAGTSGKPAVMGNLSLNNGTLNDGGKTLLALGNIANSATHTSGSGGKIDLPLGVQSVTITNPGSYQLPSVTTSAGSGASFKMTIIDGKITAITVVSGGTGYSAGSLIFGNEAGTGAAASFSVNSGVITSVSVTNGGSGYGPAVTISNSSTGNDAILQTILTTTTASTTTSGIGVVSAVNLIYPGSDYSSGLPSVTVVPPTIGAAAIIPATVSVSTNTVQTLLSGNGSGQFGNLSINNPGGAELTANMTVNGALNLAVDGNSTDGLLYLNNYKLTLTASASIAGVSVLNDKRFIRTNGVLSDGGLEKVFTNGLSNATFLFPVGVTGKYTPADYTLSTDASVSSLAVKPIDATHPNVNPTSGLGPDYLKYYWNVTGNVASLIHKYHYIATDAVGDPNNYISARFSTPVWDKGLNADVDPTNHVISFNKAGAIAGDYTAGENNVLENPTAYVSNNSGDYTNINIWTPTPPVGGPPSGSIVTISINNTVVINENSKSTTSLTIYGTLDLGFTNLHSFGIVEGDGLLRISANNTDFAFPAGNYDAFTSKTGGTVEYYGSVNGTLLTQSTFNYVIFSGNSTKQLIQNITVNGDLTINDEDGDGTLSNTSYNKNITLKGNWVNKVGVAGFDPGTGTVTFNGGAPQTIGSDPTIFNNITFSGSTVTNKAKLTANGNLTIGNGATLQNTDNIIDLKGNWTNNGSYEGGSTTSGVILSGTNQLVGGTTSTSFNNLTIDGGANKTLNQLISVTGKLTLKDGYLVSNSTNLLKLGTSASVTGASDDSFVAGPMTKDIATANVSGAFTFPIGKIVNGTGRYAQIDIINASNATYTAEYFAATPANNGSYNSPLTGVSDVEYWKLTSSTNNAANVKLTYRPSSGFPGITVPASRVYIVRYDTVTTNWKDITTFQNISATQGSIQTDNTLFPNEPKSFGLFTFGFTSSEFVSLPVRMLTFTGKWNNGKVDLEWLTASEENNSYFEVERSADAQHFVSIGGLDGKGTTNFTQRYQFTDENPLAGISYYRLKQVDSNGDFEYSKIISIVNPTVTDVMVLYPNPVANSEQVSLQINSAEDNAYLVTVHDVQGKILARNEYPTVKGMNELPILQHIHLASGMYFVRVQAGLFNRQFKLVVE